MVQNIKNREISEHPLERIRKIMGPLWETVITTTGVHIARRIGALYKAYEGDFD